MRSRLRQYFYFYPRPPRGGRQDARREVPDLIPFLSTSSARRTTRNRMADCGITQISIHVLREEDDNPGAGASVARRYFYPRPPRGGRRSSARERGARACISIHVLREEDDSPSTAFCRLLSVFLSTSSARRTTDRRFKLGLAGGISIHVLREEDDARQGACGDDPRHISIHVLREEDDTYPQTSCSIRSIFLSTSSARRTTITNVAGNRRAEDFYPRPPRGGRPLVSFLFSKGCGQFLSTSSARRTTCKIVDLVADLLFLSTSSARRTTGGYYYTRLEWHISIHVLREEDDARPLCAVLGLLKFLSTSSARRTTVGHQFEPIKQKEFLSTSSARRTTLAAALASIESGYFYPRPPRGGRQKHTFRRNFCNRISIHVLREEDDAKKWWGEA